MADKKKTYNFGERSEEPYGGVKIPVWQSPKFLQARKKAIEAIESGKYNLAEDDFWILKNTNKEKTAMAYTSLIISHNGCLKINDALGDNKFKPSCVSCDKSGYKESLIFTYSNDEQGVFEVGEVSTVNCKNDYPYAMAYKRLFDRVVLKLSKFAFSGIMSDSESDDFKMDANICNGLLKPVTNEPLSARTRLMHKLIELGINLEEYTKEKQLPVFVPDIEYEKYIKELEEKYNA